MKKIIALVLTALLALSLVACGSETKTDDADKTEDKTSTALTGTVSTDGSTSMEKVIGALSESFMAQNGGVTVNYNPTGSGSGITAVASEMGYAAAGLQRQALFSIALVLFLFIMLINAALNFFLKRSKEK